MNKQFGNDDPTMAAYIARTYAPEDAVLREIRERSARAGLPDIQVAALDGRHLEVLARATGARRAVEIGTLGGYSGVCLLRGMGPSGFLHTLEIEPLHVEVAGESYRRAGVADRVRIHLGSAHETLPRLASEGPFDLVFLDADKVSYDAYLGWAEANLRPGGVLLADNAFLFGDLPGEGEAAGREDVVAMQRFHARLARGDRWSATVLPTGEGLTLAVKLG